MLSFRICTTVAALLLVSQAQASSSAFGVDDWGPTEISKFFKNAGLDVTADAVIEAGLEPNDLFDGQVTLDVLNVLGITSTEDQLKALKALVDLDAKITANPADFFEYRTANLREVDYWWIPLSNAAPRATVFFAGPMDNDNDKAADALERVDDVLDEGNPVVTFLMTLFIPSYKMSEIVADVQIESEGFFTNYIDTVVRWLLRFRILKEVLDLIMTVLNPSRFKYWLLQTIGHEVAGVLGVSFMYYIGWHIFPFAETVVASFVFGGSAMLAAIAAADSRREFEKALEGISEMTAAAIGLGVVAAVLFKFLLLIGLDLRATCLNVVFYFNLYVTIPCVAIVMGLGLFGAVAVAIGVKTKRE